MREYFAKAHNRSVKAACYLAGYLSREGDMVRQSTSTTRKATLGIAAAAMLAATSLASPTRADEPGKGTAAKIDGLPAQCLKAGNELAQLKCGTTYYRQRRLDAEARGAAADAHSAEAKVRSSDAKARSAAADTRAAEADKEGTCLNLIMQDLESNGAKTAGLSEPPKKGEACKIAKSLKLVVG